MKKHTNMNILRFAIMATLAAGGVAADRILAGTADEPRVNADNVQTDLADPRGPIENAGMQVSVGEGGVEAFMNFSPQFDDKPMPGTAHWIWLKSDNEETVAGCFRKEIVLSELPRMVTARMSADQRYRLYINGKLAARGPVDSGQDWRGGTTGRWFYDYRDLTAFFRKGTNVITSEVFQAWFVGHTVSRGHPGFLFEAEVTLPDQSRLKLKTDESWRAIPADYFSKASKKPTGRLIYEAAKEPAGWRLSGFDDTAWPPCTVVADIWSPLTPSEIPPLMEARYPVKRIERVSGAVAVPNHPFEAGQSVFVKSNGGFSVVFDRELSAYPTLKIKGGKGAQVTVMTNQRNAPGATRAAVMKLGDGVQFFDFPFIDGLNTINLLVTNVTSPVEFQDVGAVFTSQPVLYQGSFTCSDETLNRIWKISRWAAQMCLQTQHVDSPNHQEPLCDAGDYVIEAMANYYAFGQPWLARQDLRKIAWILKSENYQNFHTSYSMAWLQMLLDYYDYTGDKSLVAELSPYVFELLDTYTGWRGKSGIISEAPNYMFMDWVTIGGFACHHPPAVIGQGYLTAFYCHGLDQARRVAQIVGDPVLAEKYQKLRRETAAAFNRELWVGNKGLYRDGKPFQSTVQPYEFLPADKVIETFSPHVNALAVLFDLAPKERQPAILERILADQPLNTQPWFMHWVFNSLDHAGLFDQYGAAQMRRWTLLENNETQSFRERWAAGDLSHGWCSTPLVQMSARILGVTPAAPGFKTISIRPSLCDLTWAKGKVPTPLGEVAVAWVLGDDKLTLEVAVPAGAEADVVLPVGRFGKTVITLDGKRVEAQVRIAAGVHHFQVVGRLNRLNSQTKTNPPS
jgi:alpha-L-rhamnosidase